MTISPSASIVPIRCRSVILPDEYMTLVASKPYTTPLSLTSTQPSVPCNNSTCAERTVSAAIGCCRPIRFASKASAIRSKKPSCCSMMANHSSPRNASLGNKIKSFSRSHFLGIDWWSCSFDSIIDAMAALSRLCGSIGGGACLTSMFSRRKSNSS